MINYDELKQLCLLNGTSGREHTVRNYILRELEHLPLGECHVSVDRLGNVIVRKQGAVSHVPPVMLAAHMDEVAMMVTDINEDGTLRFGAVGGMDPAAVTGTQVKVGVDGIDGVIGVCPIHRLDAAQRKKFPEMDSLAVDIGAKDRKETEQYVSLGDVISFAPAYQELGMDKLAAKALDDRFGCAVLLSLLRSELPCDVTVVFTVQEEVGLRGAAAAAAHIKPHVAIVLETTTAADLPGSENAVCSLGKGAVVSYMDGRTIYDAGLYDLAVSLCRMYDIPWQTKTKIAGGNDAGAIQNSGARVLAVSVPCRYLHSPLCVMQRSDGEACEALVRRLLEHIAAHGVPEI